MPKNSISLLKKFIKMQEVSIADFNKTLDKINNYSTFDLLKDMIKYKVIPEFIKKPSSDFLFISETRQIADSYPYRFNF